MTIDFTAHRHPVLAVECPSCKARAGVWCQRPSEHGAGDLHVERGKLADKVFIEQHGAQASIDGVPGDYSINQNGYVGNDGQLALDL